MFGALRYRLAINVKHGAKAEQQEGGMCAWKSALDSRSPTALCTTQIAAVSYTHLTLPTTPYV